MGDAPSQASCLCLGAEWRFLLVTHEIPALFGMAGLLTAPNPPSTSLWSSGKLELRLGLFRCHRLLFGNVSILGIDIIYFSSHWWVGMVVGSSVWIPRPPLCSDVLCLVNTACPEGGLDEGCSKPMHLPLLTQWKQQRLWGESPTLEFGLLALWLYDLGQVILPLYNSTPHL